MNEDLKNQIIDAIKTVYDPEIPVNVYDLGLIYEVDEIKPGVIKLIMTLTTPNCPVAGSLPMEVQTKVLEVEGIDDVEMQVVFDPPWTKDRMSEEARFALDMF
ncbi:MAG: DUF59 domain-containing protein [Saprospirales bacterium]|nr:MAG: DUF59 domain-containing protein [Saprospirales bacterium]